MSTNIFIEVISFLVIPFFSNCLLNVLGTLKMFITVPDRPLDYGIAYKGKRLLGESSTVLGLLSMLVMFALLYSNDYSLWQCALPLLTYLGHALGSFIKRRVGVPSGTYIPILDSCDYVFVCGIFCITLGKVSFEALVISICIVTVVQPIITSVIWLMGLRRNML